ncbi:MAG: hypothetical protein DHS20C17_17830 [Cyclobacteriaceae bacterium]|nr:MAG: hypothetical protein DHS20C17_17830 [Cyclobacteriaceae bacterium]
MHSTDSKFHDKISSFASPGINHDQFEKKVLDKSFSPLKLIVSDANIKLQKLKIPYSDKTDKEFGNKLD